MRCETITRICVGFWMVLPLVAWAADPLGVALTFTPRNKCQGESPKIRLTQIPPGTVAYKVQMIDGMCPASPTGTKRSPPPVPSSRRVQARGATTARAHPAGSTRTG